jgi:chemotaxis protein histidine kinase CheA
MPLSQEDQSKYKALYLQTAREYVKELHDNANALIVTPDSVDDLASLHRAAHSLNSQSNMMEYKQMASVASVLETLFKQTQDNKTALTKEVLQSILDTVEHMSQNLDAIDKDSQETDLSEDAAKLQALVQK